MLDLAQSTGSDLLPHTRLTSMRPYLYLNGCVMGPRKSTRVGPRKSTRVGVPFFRSWPADY